MFYRDIQEWDDLCMAEMQAIERISPSQRTDYSVTVITPCGIQNLAKERLLAAPPFKATVPLFATEPHFSSSVPTMNERPNFIVPPKKLSCRLPAI